MKVLNRIPKVSIRPTLFVGLGGAGRDTARLTQLKYVKELCDLLELGDEGRKDVLVHLAKLITGFYVDSDQWEEVLIEPRFAGETPERLLGSRRFAPLDSPSGRYIIEHVQTHPFTHLRDWPRLQDITSKSSNAEAEGNRLYGEANLYVNIREVASDLATNIEQLRSLIGGDSWQSLVAYGVPITDQGYRIEICLSLSGGQGTGSILVLLGLIAKLIEDEREGFKINLNLLLPGFFPSQNDAEELEQHFKALSVLHDLALLKLGGAPLEVFHPAGKIELTERHTTELFDHLFVYQPAATDKARYESFICRVSQSMINAELTAVASDLRRARSNALELSRRNYSKKKLTVVGG